MLTKTQIRKQATSMVLDLLEEHDDSVTKVGRALGGVNKGLIHRVAGGGYSETVNAALGLPSVQSVELPVCEGCGGVHEIKKMCTKDRVRAKKRRRKAADLDPGDWGIIQNRALDKFASMAGFESWSEFVFNLANTYIAEFGNDFVEDTLDEILDSYGLENEFVIEFSGSETPARLNAGLVNAINGAVSAKNFDVTVLDHWEPFSGTA